MNKDNVFLSVSILIAGVLIAGAVIYSNNGGSGANVANIGDDVVGDNTGSPTKIAFRPIDDTDHIRGDKNAPVKIIEYSDLECPFCKRFHPTLQQAVDEYKGKVAWVYRHFPLDALHSKARKEAEASECANELGGNDAFWTYVDKLYEVTPSNDGLDLALLPQLASQIGLDKNKFASCLASGKYADHVAADLKDAENSGGRGTPWTVVINADGETFPVSGALPYAQVKAVIEQALQ